MLRSSLGTGKSRVPVLRQPTYGRWLRSNNHALRWNQFRRAASTVTNLESYPNVGEQLHGFTVQEKKHVPELHLTAVRLKHDKTDADYLHVAREDKNNVFGVGFKTNPPDATGVPHILEHTTLCGSEKYPVRDPFFKMLPRSLSNFMNAFTSADHTTYPFATTNQQDFQNLLSVYLDATLHPLLKEEDFRQEGWRLGPEDPRAGDARDGKPEDVLFKGVVYNEMKGQISDANYLYYIKYRESIFPALNNSGGDPQYITDLTHKQLVEFSQRNYHPSNAKFLTYGDMPLSAHLKQIGDVLDGFGKGEADTSVKLPIDLSRGPLNVTVPGPIDTFADADKQYKTSTSWYLGDTSEVVETFSAGILSSLLLDGYGSPMYRALIESGLGSSFTPNTGLDTSGKVPVFSVGLTGVGEEDAPKVKEAIQRVYQDSLSTGFSDEKVQGFLHQLELALRHKTANFGIGVMEKTISSWFNGVNPMKELAWNDVINEFKKRYQQGGYLESLMQKYLMNDRCLTFTMVGTPTFHQELDQQEMVRKEQKLSQLVEQHGSMEKAISTLREQELQLLKTQEEAQHADLGCLPSLRVEDISREKEHKPVRESKVDDIDVVWREAPTNGLTYFQALNAFDDLPDDLRLLMPLFNDCIMRLGTANKTMEQWEDLIKLKTGGVSSSAFHTSSPVELGKFDEGLQFSGFALDKNIPDMLEILTTLITETDFTSAYAPAMIQELLRLTTNGALDSVAASGHRFALNAAAAGLSRSFWVQEQQSGLAQLQATANLLRDAETSPERLAELIEKLRLIQSFAISKSSSFRVRMVCEPSSAHQNEVVLQKWLAGLPQIRSPTSGNAGSMQQVSSKAFYEMPYKVYYSGLAMQTVPFVHKSSAPLSVLSQLLTHNYLHPEIREKGGAYGAAASNGPVKGIFALTSYRDPNPLNTLKVFQNSGIFARDRSWSERELNEAKLGIFQGLDAPMSVDEEGSRYFMSGVTHEMDQRWREQLLDVTARDVNEVAQNFLVDGPRQSVCLLGEKKDWAEGWDVRKLSMNAGEVEAIPEDASTAA
ncbi:Metalloenzyme, LuxS/M16 peptidase-like protein [Aspergillus pseudotamarii]|uniref:Presequence protease, mitochondrial n=1 Tax=Aspergillus pseudotamarii TaxID=132259 RepID=A0A5N6SMB8_ASPPS|nr:Metalloenzyme, LuxS/M16 peptidase-like protein [Aspergillus pseudotamarii]KAE8134274.1 Metalloenzyme, LuxS/M16 peptidase-like protein [Aspergillus pseudotamarii]